MEEYWLEPPEPVIVCECEQCGRDIYLYDEVRVIEKGCSFIHDDCLLDWMLEQYPLIEITKEDVY